MDYLVVKALHIIGLVGWMGALMSLGVFSAAALAVPQGEGRTKLAELGRKIYFSVDAPAMALAFTCGVALIMMQPDGYLKSQPWLHTKITLVVGIGVIDHMLMHRFRKFSQDTTASPILERAKTLVIIALALGAVAICLAVLKPFVA